MDFLDVKNAIELYDEMAKFANHHMNLGGQEAHKLIKRKLIDEVKSLPRDGSEDMEKYYEGYDRALKDVFGLLHKRFVP